MENINIILISLTTIGSFLGLFVIFRLLIKLKKPDIKLNTKFFEQLDKKFDLDLINNKEDIIVLADSFRREHIATYDLSILLGDYLRYLISIASTKEEGEKNKYIERHKKTNDILKVEIEEKPYNELPLEERRIFRAINSAVKSEEKDEILNALEDLRIIISSKSKTYQQSNVLNRFSIPLAIIGLILTIYFGIKSLPVNKNNTVDKIEITEPLLENKID